VSSRRLPCATRRRSDRQESPTPKSRQSAPPIASTLGSAGSTVGGPASGIAADPALNATGPSIGALAAKQAGTPAMAKAMPSNPLKPLDHGLDAGHAPQEGPWSNPLDDARVDSAGQARTTTQGVLVSDNQNSLKAGLRGPTLLEDFVLREMITHFDHERIPERIVHARGSAAHGYFECSRALGEVTKAAPFREVGKRTPGFVRFSTVAGERGSTDTARDVRGFAVKLYTDEGNWDLVGNNIPVFFIQDAMKFPDLIHAAKPEPHHGMPQAATAHDTFWDFASLSPETAHMLMRAMSDRAIPRSYRMMQGFGVHTFRLINEAGESRFVKFHWTPSAGTHSLVWDEAVKLSGCDSDFHRRDLWEAIEAGNYPEWTLGLQVFTEEQAAGFTFDILDPTKLIPEELVPVVPVGRMVLDRNPDNFFAETEQVTLCTAHVVPGIDFSNDPLLQGRIHSYLDTQISRLGGGCPSQAGARGFVSFPEPVTEDKVRGKPEKFADHFSQATLFFNSQSEVEKNHIVAAFRFELTRVQTPAIRQRVVSLLRNIDETLAARVADGLGRELPPAQPRALEPPVKAEVDASPPLSLFAFPGDGSIAGRRIALMVADRADDAALQALYDALVGAGASPRYIGAKLGKVKAKGGGAIEIEATLETMPSPMWDAVVIDASADALAKVGPAVEFVKEQFRHCKTILVNGAAGKGSIDAFIKAVGKHKHYEREKEPSPV
jgi:catalase